MNPDDDMAPDQRRTAERLVTEVFGGYPRRWEMFTDDELAIIGMAPFDESNETHRVFREGFIAEVYRRGLPPRRAAGTSPA